MAYSEEQKEAIKKLINKEITKTESYIVDYKEMSAPIAPENAIGRVSRMDAINNKSVTEAALRQAQEKLKALNIVRGTVDDKEFGICKRCQSQIPIGRILIRPHSHLCVRCAV